MQTYPEMNRIIVGMIEDSEHLHVQYAAARIKELEQELDMVEYASLAQRIAIEELEQQLREAQEAAQAQSETAQHDWLSPAEAEGLRRQLSVALSVVEDCNELNAEFIKQYDDERQIAEKAEALLADAMDELQAERQEHQGDAHTIHALRRELREAKADLATMDADRQNDRLSNPHFGTSPRYLVEVQRDRLKDECERLRQELQAAREIVV